MGTIILSAFVAHTAWHWMLDRGAVLRQLPRRSCRRSTPALAASAVRGLMFLLVIGAAAWGVFELYGRLTRGSARETWRPDAEAK